ncbi:hypothetical protein BGZ50_001885, partial [Haplosporangium sp. Z 11]
SGLSPSRSMILQTRCCNTSGSRLKNQSIGLICLCLCPRRRRSHRSGRKSTAPAKRRCFMKWHGSILQSILTWARFALMSTNLHQMRMQQIWLSPASRVRSARPLRSSAGAKKCLVDIWRKCRQCLPTPLASRIEPFCTIFAFLTRTTRTTKMIKT